MNPFDPTDHRSILERSDDWLRVDDEPLESSPRQYVPQKRWTYYLAIIIAIGILIALVSGMGAIILKKGSNLMQRYIERFYGIE